MGHYLRVFSYGAAKVSKYKKSLKSELVQKSLKRCQKFFGLQMSTYITVPFLICCNYSNYTISNYSNCAFCHFLLFMSLKQNRTKLGGIEGRNYCFGSTSSTKSFSENSAVGRSKKWGILTFELSTRSLAVQY